MRLLVLSDLHLELGTALNLHPCLGFDVAVLAGDIHSPGHKAVHWAQRASTFGGKPVILVPGNHEFYGREMGAELAEMSRVAQDGNVHLMNRRSVVIDGVRFLGCILWTDFLLPVRKADGTLEADVGQSLAAANRAMNDFAAIKVAALVREEIGWRDWRLLRAEDTLAMHQVDLNWLRGELRKPFDGPTVVVTHHAPASGSVAQRYAGDTVTPAFVSELSAAMFEVPLLWVHGHTHTPANYQRGRCRVLSNPRGYRYRDSSFDENDLFDAGCVVELREGAAHMVDTQHELQRAEADLAERADMVELAEAAKLARVSRALMRRWVDLRRPGVIALQHPQGPRMPRWQFSALLWPVVQRLARALDAGSATMLAWLERPHEGLEGRTPRAALEQGEPAAKVLALAAAEGR